MATITASLDHALNLDNFDIYTLDGDYLYLANATTWRVGPSFIQAGSHVQFQGVGFTYTGGALTGGTINTITKHSNGAMEFQFSGLSLSAAAYQGYLTSGESGDFVAAVLNGDDTITGSNLKDWLLGYAGKDTLTGLDGDDLLDGGAGSDVLVGGDGDDTYFIDSAGDVIQEKSGSYSDKVISKISVDLTKAVFDGIEHANLSGNADLFVTGDSGSNMIKGNAGNNTLAGNGGTDQIWGNAGNDKIDGGSGGDYMYGGAGNDTYTVDSVVDTVSESSPLGKDVGGMDTVLSGTKSFALPDFVENLTLTGAALNGTGNDLENVLIGNALDNILDGKDGADTMTGGGGNDTYVVDDAAEKITETSTGGTADKVYSGASYTLSSHVELLILSGNGAIDGKGNGSSNTILGNNAANTIDGAAGNDDLIGGSGDDTIIGGAGNDLMAGCKGDDTIDTSLGDDTVVYMSKADGTDTILGFDGNATGGQDRLQLHEYFDQLGVDIEGRAGRVGIVDNGAVVDVWIDTDGNKFLDVKIAEIHTTDVIKVGEDVVVAWAV